MKINGKLLVSFPLYDSRPSIDVDLVTLDIYIAFAMEKL